MTVNEAINKLETAFGKYETWTEDIIDKISENDEQIKLFTTPGVIKEFNSKENPNCHQLINDLMIGENLSLVSSIIKKIDDPSTSEEEKKKALEILDKDGDSVYRLMKLLIDIEDGRIQNKEDLDIEKVKKDIVEVQNMFISVSTSFDIEYSLYLLISQAQELIYNIINEDILNSIENPAYNDKLELFDESRSKYLIDMIARLNEQEGKKND